MILMINTMKMRLIFPFVLLIYSLICQADGGKDSYIFRKVDYQQGLSNSAVLCLFQVQYRVDVVRYLRWSQLL